MSFTARPCRAFFSPLYHLLPMLRSLSILCLLLLSPCTARAAEPPSEQQVLEWMRELKPLPKVHYSWPLPFKSISEETLFEYVRLTHAASISGEWSKDGDIERAVEICQRVNAKKPKIPASIGINYSPWHRRFGKELPPTDTGSTHQQELDYLTERLTSVRNAVAAANKSNQSDVKISAILFDSERFHTKTDDAAWNTAMTAKYNAVYDIARRIFPGVKIEWYARGAVHPGASSTGWAHQRYFTLKEKGESFGCSLYHGPEIELTRSIFRKTAAKAEQHNCNEVTPWIALASGYRRQTDKYHEWSLNWNYDLIYSWQLGLEINQPWWGKPEHTERFAPWHKAKIAIFYPEPFGRSKFWGQHFVAYVRGANRVKELPEIDNE